MLQFYFLSIVLNALAGFILISGDEVGVLEFKSSFSLKDETLRLVAGILSVVIGVLKILSPIEGDIPVVGDLVPAAAGILAGLVLVFEYYWDRSTLDASAHDGRIDRILVSNKKIIGVAAIIAAGLHFLFPKVLLL